VEKSENHFEGENRKGEDAIPSIAVEWQGKSAKPREKLGLTLLAGSRERWAC